MYFFIYFYILLTTLKPRPFLPGPFSNWTLCRDIDSDLGRGRELTRRSTE